MLYLEWETLYPFNPNSDLTPVTTKAGIYIFAQLISGNFYVKYVGQAKDIQCRLQDHQSIYEQNTDLKMAIRRYDFKVLYAEVPYQTDRDGIELFLYNKFRPTFNKYTPPGDKEISVNI